MTTSLYSASARPSASKPGPRFAELAGTRTRTRMAKGYSFSRKATRTTDRENAEADKPTE